MRAPFVFLLAGLCLSGAVAGQQFSGTVTDAASGQPVVSALVWLENTAFASVTDKSGGFSFVVPSGSYRLSVRHLGYAFHTQDVTVPAAGLGQLDVPLQPAAYTLNSEVVVSAQRIGQEGFQRPEAVSVLSPRQLADENARTVPEALAGTTGVFVQKTNHGGGSPFVRGLTGHQTLVMVDGIRINSAIFRSGPNQYLNTLDPLIVEHAEVLRGGGSVQYGSDALGGTVQLFTKSPAFSGQPRTGAAFFGKLTTAGMEQTGRLSLEHSRDRLAVAGGFSYSSFGDIVAGGNIGRQDPTGYRQFAADTKLKARLSGNSLLTVAGQHLQQTGVPLFHRVRLEDFSYYFFSPQARSLAYARLEHFGGRPWAKKLTFTASWQQSAEARRYQREGRAFKTEEFDRTDTFGGQFQVNSRLSENWTAVSGIDVYHDHVSSRRENIPLGGGPATALRGLYPDGARMGSLAVYSMHTLDFSRLVLSFGGRFNAFRVSVPDETLGNTLVTPAALVWNTGLLYRLGRAHHLVLGAGTAFRAPNIDDFGSLGIVDFRYELPTRQLAPESSLNLEAGYKLKTGKTSGSVFLFHNRLDGLIDRIRQGNDSIQGFQVYRKENVAEAYIQGAEAEFAWLPLRRLSVYGNAVYAFGQNVSRNEPFRRIPPFHGRLGIRYQHVKGGWAKLEALAAGKQGRLAAGDVSDNRIPEGGTPGWQTVSLSAGYRWAWGSVSGNLHNIGDTGYRTHGSGVDAFGRCAWLAVQAWF